MSISSSLNVRFFHAMTHFHKRIVMVGFSLIHAYQMKFKNHLFNQNANHNGSTSK